ncbi:MAG TPA: peptidase M61 [Usitatibacter sp.]|nr:peptidase M61 [Usitatibacter sp.]
MNAARLLLASFAIAAAAVSAQGPAQPFRDAYPGVIALAVDATDLDRHIFRVKETIPVTPGPLRLLYPQWIPGHHAPTGPITLVAGLRLAAGGAELEWHRDPKDVYAFDLTVPHGVDAIEASFDFLSPLKDDQGRVNVTPQIVALDWIDVLLYPAGVRTDGIRMQASARFPRDWTIATSLSPEGRTGEAIRFAPVSLTELADSPAWAGRSVKRLDLDPGAAAPVSFDLVAESPASLEASDEHVAPLRELVRQAYKVFGGPYYRHYDFLIALSEPFSRIGLEHLQSTEIREPPHFLSDWKTLPQTRTVLSHEFVHSWIGKKHRPADLATPNFNVPMGDTLLWVYEGETDYWTYMLAARSGLLSREQSLDAIARAAAWVDAQNGREWRNLQDTTNQPVMARDRDRAWTGWQRSFDYYGESVFLWMEVDARLRDMTGGSRSMNDFARAFHGSLKGEGIATFTFDDVANALHALAPGDWKSFLRERLDSRIRHPAAEALRAAGWRLVYTDKPSEFSSDADREEKRADFQYSLGFTVGRDDEVSSVAWDGPAFRAGMPAHVKLLAVNGYAYKEDRLKQAITAAKASGEPIALLVKYEDYYRTIAVPYTGGLRYPHLERIEELPDRLGASLSPM